MDDNRRGGRGGGARPRRRGGESRTMASLENMRGGGRPRRRVGENISMASPDNNRGGGHPRRGVFTPNRSGDGRRPVRRGQRAQPSRTSVTINEDVLQEKSATVYLREVTGLEEIHVEKETFAVAERRRIVDVSLPSRNQLRMFNERVKDIPDIRMRFNAEGEVISDATLRFKRQVQNSKEIFLDEAGEVLRKHDLKILEAKTTALDIKFDDPAGSLSDEMLMAEAKLAELERQKEVFEKNMNRYLAIYDSWLETEEFEDIKPVRAQYDALGFKTTLEMQQLKESLPMYAFKEDLIMVLEENPVTIVLAETGSGKSTLLTQFLYQAGYGETGVIACSQPRKVASASLAKYVAKCAKSTEGLLVGYSAGVTSRHSPTTKIFYATDGSLLRKFAKDPLLSDYSVVIVDEAHERNIFTDLLIGMLKKVLAVRDDLKVIVTSATIDPEPFVKFFQDAPVFQVPGRVYPVEVCWLPDMFLADPQSSFVEQAVEVAAQIHRNGRTGDILCFLPSPLDITLAMDFLNARNLPNIAVFELHGRLQVEDQMKIFEPVPAGVRKIVFATNVAETSVTIPGIVNVIDTGLAKEVMYDELRNIGRLEVCQISRSSADQRKGRAGRTAPGMCFRMFTEAEYLEMRPCLLPEILRTHLGQAILTLMDAGVTDPLSFDFVAPPKRTALIGAFNSLMHLGAIAQNGEGKYELTPLGVMMAKLPVEPRLARLVLRGLEENVGFEAAMLAALASGYSVFYRFGTDEEKQQADIKRLKFCLPEGDFISMLYVYKLWDAEPERRKAAFSVRESLNNKSMKTARTLFQEIQRVVLEMTHRRITYEFAEDEQDVRKVLIRLIAECFSENICVYSGWDAGGYISVLRGAQVWPHPGSTLNYLGKLSPRYFVFESVLTTSADWALNITPVSRALLEELQSTGMFATLEQLDAYSFNCRIIQPVGPLILKRRILGRRAERLRTFTAEFSEKLNAPTLNVTAEVDNGRLIITCLDEDETQGVLDQVEAALKAIIDEESKSITKRTLAETFKNTAGVESRVQCRIGAGFMINDILRPGDYRQLNVLTSRKDFNEESLKVIFADHMDHVEYIIPDRAPSAERGTRFKVLFNSAVIAEDVYGILPAVVTHAEDLSILPGPRFQNNIAPQNFSLIIKWARRKNRGFGFVSFESAADLGVANVLFNSGTMTLRGNPLTMTVSVSNKRQLELFCRTLPPDLTIDEFKDCLTAHKVVHKNASLALEEKKTTTNDIVLQYREAFAILVPRMEGFHMYDMRPETSEYKVVGHFARSELLREAIERVNGAMNPVDGNRMRALPRSNLKVTASEDVVACVEPFFEPFLREVRLLLGLGLGADDLEVTKERVGNRRKNQDQRRVDPRVTYTVKAKDFGIAVEVHLQLTDLFQGHVLKLTADRSWEKILSSENAVDDLIRSIQERTRCKTLYRKHQKMIVFFGTRSILDAVKDEIQRYKESADQAGSIYNFRLAVKVGKGRGILQRLTRLYGDDLQRFQERVGARAVLMDTRRHVLTVTGTVEAYNAAKEEVDRIIRGVGQQDAGEIGGEHHEMGEQCPICLEVVSFHSATNAATEGQGFCYRLEACGHAYCSDCLQALIAQAELPVVCVIQNCGKSLSTYEFEKFVLGKNDNNALKGKIMAAAGQELATRNAADQNAAVAYIHCPTADCSMILKSVKASWDNGATLENCPLCHNDVCVKCGVAYHHGVSCELYNMIHNDGDIQGWLRSDPVNHRLCPSCSAPIEKAGGCNHVECTKCKAHFCFACRLNFQSIDAVYAHLRLAHP